MPTSGQQAPDHRFVRRCQSVIAVTMATLIPAVSGSLFSAAHTAIPSISGIANVQQ